MCVYIYRFVSVFRSSLNPRRNLDEDFKSAKHYDSGENAET